MAHLTFTEMFTGSFRVLIDKKGRISCCRNISDFFHLHAFEFYLFAFLWFRVGVFFPQHGNETPWSVTPELPSDAASATFYSFDTSLT